MKDNVQLYIGGMPVDLSDNVDVLFTYAADDMTNPTIVRNSYSKQITLEDSPENSRVFGQFWNLERTQDFEGQYGISFNPSKRVPFTLYVNSEIYQSGYCKLTSVKKNGKNNVYEIILFGGLGSFFFNLAYLDNDTQDNNKRKLSDLHFMTWNTSTPSEREFDFTIKQQTIQDAWENVNASDSSLWHYINFADTYDGYPDDFDANKVLMYLGTSASTTSTQTTGTTRRPGGTGSNSIPTSSSTTEGNYATFDGYTVAELPKEKTAQQMREFRSYLMRPVLRVKEVINACCAPENNGGYTVELDPTFFNVNNPYWEDAWMTLPSLSSMNFSNVEGDEQTGVTATVGATVTGGTKPGVLYKETTTITLGEISAASSFNFSMDLNVQAIMNALPSGYKTQDSDYVYNGLYPQAMSPAPIYPCAYSTYSSTYYPGTICVQLVAYSRDGKVINGSDIMSCTNGYNPYRSGRDGRQTSVYVPTPNDFPSYTPEYNAGYVQKPGAFTYVSGSTSSTSTWQMESTLNFRLNKLPKTCTLKLIITKLNGAEMANQNKAMLLYQRYYTNYTTEEREGRTYLTSSFSTAYRNPAVINHFNLVLSNVDVSLVSEEGIRTGAKFTKSDLLNTDYSPADFLLSYAKLFGLYFEKDKYDDYIYVRTRDTFYRKENVIDISKRIDHSKPISITPMVFDAKWYNWSLKQEKSQFGDEYQGTYGLPYEIQKVNTGYNFDSSEKELYKDNIFKGTVDCLEKSDMFGYVEGTSSTPDDVYDKPWMYDGFSYNLYAVDDAQDTLEIDIKARTKKGVIKSYSDNAQYDLYNKLQLHGENQSASDGGNILVFFTGYVPTRTKNTDKEINYYITDDNTYMNTLNDGNACWLYTRSEIDSGGARIATKVDQIPHFSRYRANDSVGRIIHSWGFGVPKQLYIPDYTTNYSTTLYDNYWRSYIKDMYDIDTKKLSCYVRLDERPSEDWLRDFYWFDNSIWRINRIIEANINNKNSTNIEFIKVQDRYNYSNMNVSSVPTISVSASTTGVTNIGATVTIYVNVSDGGGWYVSDDVLETYNPSVSSGQGNGSFTIQIPHNQGTERIVHRIAVQNDYDQWGICEIVQQDAVLTVTEFASHTGQDIPWSGGTQMYDVRASYPWAVINVDNRPYVTLDPLSGQGGGLFAEHFECTFSPSDSLAPRSVLMRFTDIAGNSLDVWKWQEACKQIVFDATGGTKDYQFLSGYNTMGPDWLNVQENQTTAGTYEFTAVPNPGLTSRTTTVVFTDGSGNTTPVQVIQNAAPVLDVQRTDGSGNVLSSGGNITLTVSSNTPWTGTSSADWATLGITGGSTSMSVRVFFDENTGVTREAVFTFVNGYGDSVTYKQTQAGQGTVSVVSPTSMLFYATGGSQTITIKLNSWSVVSTPQWATVSQSSGSTTGTTVVTVPPYSGTEQRVHPVIILDTDPQGDHTAYVVLLTQLPPEGEMLAASPSSFRFSPEGGTGTITIISNTDWTIG